jgi:hypothetical protein
VSLGAELDEPLHPRYGVSSQLLPAISKVDVVEPFPLNEPADRPLINLEQVGEIGVGQESVEIHDGDGFVSNQITEHGEQLACRMDWDEPTRLFDEAETQADLRLARETLSLL